MPLATAWSRPGSYITATSACLATNGPGSEPIATWTISTSVLASMPFSLSSFMNSEVEVVGISPVTTFWPLMSLMLLNLKSGEVASHTAAPFTTLAMMSTGAPLDAAIAVHSGPWIENCALPEITAESATVGAPAVSLVRSTPCWVKKPSSIATYSARYSIDWNACDSTTFLLSASAGPASSNDISAAARAIRMGNDI